VSVPLANPGAENEPIRKELDAALARILSGGRYVLGPEVAAFEREFASAVGSEFAVGVASGTDAITLALRGVGVEPGDEVVTVSHTAGATVAAILRAGAVPVLVDIDRATMTIAVDAIEQAITPRTRAIVPVHLYGAAAPIGSVRALAERHGLAVVEDCAQAQGTHADGRHVGSESAAAAFSFYPTKNLAAIGDGGAIATSSPEIAERLIALRQYGWKTPQVSEELGWNSRLDELQAALLRVKLRHLPRHLERRREIAAAYSRQIANPDLELPQSQPGVEHSYHLYVTRTERRKGLIEHLRAHGIGAGIHYGVPVHRQPGYAPHCVAGPLPETDAAARTVLSLPLFVGMTEAAVAEVIDAVNAFRP
jgi:dTDP-4-amino-4,6-dideoxygalactose transaminase